MDNRDRLRIAYKKLKAAVFFDKTQLPLRDQLVLFEDRIEKKLAGLESALFDGVDWEKTEKEILDSIGVLVYPKKLIPVDDDMAIFNSDSIAIEMDKPQYFIDLSPVGHILGALWVLEFGAKLDQNPGETRTAYEGMYPHSYGNRLRKNLINPETKDYTYAPGLFEPYFTQYQSWRDTALDYAKARLNDKQDALILTLDFKSFFYSVDIQQSLFDRFVDILDQANQVNGGHIPATGDCTFAIDLLPLFDLSQMNMARRAYCRTRMVNKYVLPLPIDCLLDKIPLTDEKTVDLCSLTDARSFINRDWHEKVDLYRYYPYMFLPQDISLAMTYAEISAGKALSQPDKLAKQVKKTFMQLNYPLADDESRVFDLDNIKAGAIEGLPEKDERGRCFFATHVDCGEEKDHSKFRVAIGNAA